MWSMLRWIVVRLAALNWLSKTFGGLALFLPIALLLKAVGLPLLGILSVIALPVLFLLFLFGLPIFLVLLFGGMLMGIVGFVLTIGIAAIKIGIFVVLPIVLVAKLLGWMFGRGKQEPPPAAPPVTEVPPPEPGAP